jgi:2-polyprenyl-6-methoxyphenol hydroxylase-like FAD-dependent oxidoreductase
VAGEDEDRILIVGAGLAGSLLALVLGRAGRAVVVVDPRRAPAASFRIEKLDEDQIDRLRRLGVESCFEGPCYPPPGAPGAFPAEALPALADCGAYYRDWVASIRAAWPPCVEFVEDSVTAIEAGPARQTVATRNGLRLDGRLVVVATGGGDDLLTPLGLTRRVVSPGHSLTLGFSVQAEKPIPAQILRAPAGSALAYAGVFPIAGEIRINLFGYLPSDHDWIRRMARAPLETAGERFPALGDLLAGARVTRRCEARGVDLYATEGVRRSGVVVIGDAFHAPCPASGTGLTRILNDVERLAQVWLPLWLATPGMDAGKIGQFYADPVKRRLDAQSLSLSLRCRGAAVGRGPYWTARRLAGRARLWLTTSRFQRPFGLPLPG